MLEIKTYKNWKEICKIMGWNSKNGGNYKKSKLKELESICLYHKEGNKYIIDEIYDIKKDIYDGRVNNKGGNGNNRKNFINFNIDIEEENNVGIYRIINYDTKEIYIGSTIRG